MDEAGPRHAASGRFDSTPHVFCLEVVVLYDQDVLTRETRELLNFHNPPKTIQCLREL